MLSILSTVASKSAAFGHSCRRCRRIDCRRLSLWLQTKRIMSSKPTTPMALMLFDRFLSLSSSNSSTPFSSLASSRKNNLTVTTDISSLTSSPSRQESSFYKDIPTVKLLVDKRTAFDASDFSKIQRLISNLKLVERWSPEYQDHLMDCWQLLARCWNQVEENPSQSLLEPSHAWLYTEARFYSGYFIRKYGGLPIETFVQEVLKHRFWLLTYGFWEHALRLAVLQKADVEAIWNELLADAKSKNRKQFPTLDMFETMMKFCIDNNKEQIKSRDQSHFAYTEEKLMHLWKLLRQTHSDTFQSYKPYKIIWEFYRSNQQQRSINDADFLNELESKYSLSWDDGRVLKSIIEVFLPRLDSTTSLEAQKIKRREEIQKTWLKFLQYLHDKPQNYLHTIETLTKFHRHNLLQNIHNDYGFDLPACAKRMDDVLFLIFPRLDTPYGYYDERKLLVWQFYQVQADNRDATIMQILQDLSQNKHITIGTWNAILADFLLRIEQRSCNPEEDVFKQVWEILQFLENNKYNIRPNFATYAWAMHCFIALSSSSASKNSSKVSPREKVFEILDRIERNKGWSTDDLRKMYNRLLFAALNNDLALASRLLDRMTLGGAKLDGSTWFVILKHWGQKDFGSSGAERAEAILWHARELARKAPEKFAPPDADCYAVVLNSWRNRLEREKNETITKRMIKIYEVFIKTEDENLIPRDDERLTFINATIGKAVTPSYTYWKCKIGERLVSLMEQTCPKVRPDGKLFRKIIYGWLQIGNADRALSAMERYIDAYRNRQHTIISGPPPEQPLFVSVLNRLIENDKLWEATCLAETIQQSIEKDEGIDSFEVDLLSEGAWIRLLLEWVAKTDHPKRRDQITRILSILEQKHNGFKEKNGSGARKDITAFENADEDPQKINIVWQDKKSTFQNLTNKQAVEENVLDLCEDKSAECVNGQIDQRLEQVDSAQQEITDFSKIDTLRAATKESTERNSRLDELECKKAEDRQLDVSSSINLTKVTPTRAAKPNISDANVNKQVDRFARDLFLAPKTPVERNPKTNLYPRPRGRRPARAEAWDEQRGLWRLSSSAE